jgi:hypothetical protein
MISISVYSFTVNVTSAVAKILFKGNFFFEFVEKSYSQYGNIFIHVAIKLCFYGKSKDIFLQPADFMYFIDFFKKGSMKC